MAASRIRVRMGMHVSDVITDEFDIYGDGVNLAARLRDLGGPDEIVVSAAVRDQLTDGLGVLIEDLGERKLKGFDRDVSAHSVRRRRDRRRRNPPIVAAARVTSPRSPSCRFATCREIPRNDFLGELIAEDVIADLSRFSDLFVISRLSTAPFRDRSLEPRQVAEVLGVGYVLPATCMPRQREFRVRWSSRRLRTVEPSGQTGSKDPWQHLRACRTGCRSRSRRAFFRSFGRLELTRARAKRPEDLTAYELTLRAIDYLHRGDAARSRSSASNAVGGDCRRSQLWSSSCVACPTARAARGSGAQRVDSAREAGEADRHIEAALERERQRFMGTVGARTRRRLSAQGSRPGADSLRPSACTQSQRRVGMGVERVGQRMAR